MRWIQKDMHLATLSVYETGVVMSLTIVKRDFSPSFALKLMLKDADLIEKFCSSLQLPIPALGVVEKNLAAAVALGFGTENVSALIKALEKETGVEVKARRVRRSTETEQSD